MSTDLVIVGVGIAPYSARGITQTLSDIDGSIATRRTINGVLRNTTPPGFAKFKSSLSCEDTESPAFDLLPPGAIVEIHCISELAVMGDEPPVISAWDDGIRPSVIGSPRWEAGVIYYRPILTMMVLSRTMSRDEWNHAVSWSIELEEV